MILVVNIGLSMCCFSTPITRPALLASFLFFCVLLNGCSEGIKHKAIVLHGPTMGTTYNITLVIHDDHQGFDQAELQAAIDAELRVINQHMSTYIPDSEIMQLNAAAVDEWHYISDPLREVLEISQIISRKSDGAFDITVGPLVNLWGFGPEYHQDKKPTDEGIARAKSIVGYEYLELSGHQALKSKSIKLDLSAVAKGYGVDWLAAFIEARGFQHYMVEIGGELRLKGLNARGQPWRIAVEQPDDWRGSIHKALTITDAGMATSGDYRNYFEQDGKRFSHTINPATGYPIEHNLASVTVIAATAAEADAWATAINVLGPEKGLEIANTEDLAVYMIVKEENGFTDRYSAGFTEFLSRIDGESR
jgi:thiamine biosynthesis lipoprotein